MWREEWRRITHKFCDIWCLISYDFQELFSKKHAGAFGPAPLRVFVCLYRSQRCLRLRGGRI